MFRPAIIAVCAAVALPAAPALAQATSPATFVKKAGASDQYEIQSSKLLLTSTKNEGLRSFANQMVTDHTKSTADVKAAAMQAGLHPAPPMLDAMGKSNIAKLRAAHGTARDQMYVMQQKTSHQMALQLHQGYATNGTSQPLKDAAAQIAPVVQSHIDMLNGMAG